ncbi:MAG: TetR family transcriptional regulator [Actinobacteria bacterium]|nr:TetR family transcriptional regulator [Actinomycetota bacterium]
MTPERDDVPRAGVDPATLSAGQVERRERVLRTALDLGRAGGYDAVQMRDVAAEAGVALGTIYRYFASKDHLLAAALVLWVTELERQVTVRPPTGDTTTDRVLSVIKRAQRAMEREQNLSEALVTALVSPDPGAAECQRQVTLIMTRTIARGLGEDLEPDLRDDTARILGHVWFSALVGWVLDWSNIDKVSDEVEIASHLMVDHLDDHRR